jgi:hypothetical protein
VEPPLAKIEPNVMASAVACTGCHDFTKRHSRQAVGQKCVSCHEASYMAFMGEWTTGLDKAVSQAGEAVKRAEVALATARRAGRGAAEAEALVSEARRALSLVRSARGVHNPPAADALVAAAIEKARRAMDAPGRR